MGSMTTCNDLIKKKKDIDKKDIDKNDGAE